MSLDFKNAGDLIYLIGESKEDISSSQYLLHYHKVKESPTPYFNLDTEHGVQQSLKKLIKEGLIQSAHDCSEGGLFISLFESAAIADLGFEIETNTEIRKDAFLFGEAQSRVVVSVSPEKQEAFEMAMGSQVKQKLGHVVGNGKMMIDGESFGTIPAHKAAYDSVLENHLG